MEKKVFTSSLPEDMLKMLKIIAIREGITFSELLQRVVDDYFQSYGDLVTPYERRMGANIDDEIEE